MATGTVSFKNASGSIKHGWLVRGPDEMDPAKSVLRIYLSSADIGAKIKACRNLSCADAALEDGAMVDYSDARHLGYAIRLNGERVQYSGGTDGGALPALDDTLTWLPIDVVAKVMVEICHSPKRW